MPGTLVFPIDELGITKSDVLHDTGEGNVAHLDCQMDMRCHQAKGMDAVLESFNGFL